MVITFIVALSLVCALATTDDGLKVRALSFGRTIGDYVQFKHDDMSSFSSSFTVCSWMKRLHDASSPIVFHYYPWELIVGDNGYYNYANKDLDLRGKFPEAKQWFHHCLSWVAGGTQRVYVNGVELGSTSAVASNLRMGGTIAIGNHVQNSKSTNYIFGGQLYKLNWYSEELTSSEVRKMFEAGMCSTVEEEYNTRELKWELILTKQRHGNVTDFLPKECATYEYCNETEVKLASIERELKEVTTTLNDTLSELTETRKKLNETKAECRESEIVVQEKEIKLNRTKQELQEVTKTLNDTLSELTETRTKLNETKAECRKSTKEVQETETNFNSTGQELQEVTKTLNDTLLEEARSLESVSRWDVLFTPPYLNKLFTRQLYNQLTNWDMMGNYFLLFLLSFCISQKMYNLKNCFKFLLKQRDQIKLIPLLI